MAPCSSEKIVSKVAPTRLFRAGVIDLHKVVPLIVPDMVAGASVIKGDGGIGTIRQFNFIPDTERFDLLNMENFEYKKTQMEGRRESCPTRLSFRPDNYIDALPYGYRKERIDLLDEKNFEYKHTQIEGGDIGKKLASTTCHIKLVPTSDGGCKCTISAEYTLLPGVKLTEEDIKADKEQTVGLFKAVEKYLLDNPEYYA